MSLTFECCGKNVFMHEYKYGTRPHCCDRKIDMGCDDQKSESYGRVRGSKEEAEYLRRGIREEVSEDSLLSRSHDTLSVLKDRPGEYRWQRKAANGKIIAIGGEGFKNWQDAFDICQSLFPGKAILVDIAGATKEVID